MNRIETIPFTANFIERLADHICDEYAAQGKDMRRVAVVFGGHRPALFLKRALARRIKGVFYPPACLTIDDLMGRVTATQGRRRLLDLDHCFVIYQLAQQHAPQILTGKPGFVQFLPWAREILHFIEQLDLEDTHADVLGMLKAHAKVGFNVPDDINRLLQALMVLRVQYHRYLDEHQLTTRGYQYLTASRQVSMQDFPEYDSIIFCNFFYLHKTEMIVVKDLVDRGKASLFMQGDERRWPALKRIGQMFDQSIVEGIDVAPTHFNLRLYAAFDMHSQAGLTAEILKQVPDLSNAVIVLPNPDFMLPLLSSIGSHLKEFNISLGYPIKRSSIYALLESIFDAHRTMKGDLYYARDYLRVFRHPLVKGMKLGGKQDVSLLLRKVEAVLTGEVMSTISGQIFLSIADICADPQFSDDEKKVLSVLHMHVFGQWQGLSTFAQTAQVMDRFCLTMQEDSGMGQYPFNERVASRLREIIAEWAQAEFSSHRFDRDDLFRIIEERLSRELVAFSGSPLRGLQVLGLLETRSLSFDDVIVVDVNERVLPNLNIYEPLIPREVMIKMNIDRLELEEEIQRYQFMRLISSAKNVHLIYQERPDKERSRFIEELLWEQEQKAGKLGVVEITRPSFTVQIKQSQRSIPKTEKIVDFLRSFTFSATSLNTYLRNPYVFYQNYVLGLREKEDLLDDPQGKHVGTFIHGLLEDSFKPFLGKKPVIDGVFRKRFQLMFEERFQQVFGRGMKSDAFLIKAVLENRLGRFLDLEAKRLESTVKEILFIERKFEDAIPLSCGTVKFSYRVDRVDELNDGTIMILDYKTGSSDAMPSNFQLPDEMSRSALLESLVSFQMPLYLHYLAKQYKDRPVNAALYHLRTMELERFITAKTLSSTEELNSHFLTALDFCLSEIFNPKIPFTDESVEVE